MAKINIVDVVVAEIESYNIAYQVDKRGKHPKIRFTVGGRAYVYVVPMTASDHRSVLNCRAGIRRLLRQALNK